ncbi:15425_t:CDS:2 [Gigaspora margarita]|uniref:15425_t:CDS:1 n=1 Tax=Gigaspora margarita TaxID=4874 RepID=A0ABN7U5S7_GIGMA|nr:15425_t:CDS:2 [Gigaspora margarita]
MRAHDDLNRFFMPFLINVFGHYSASKKFKDFTRNTPCNVGDQACIGKDFALCAQKDTWSIMPCSNNLVCVVLPLVQKSDTIDDQNSRIQDSLKASEEINESYIDSSTLKKIREAVTLPLYVLITPSKNPRNRQVIPRPQNWFLLYRKNFSATFKLKTLKTFKLISINAAHNWSKESNEIKNFYELLAYCASIVYKKIYPGYKYKPKNLKCNKFRRKIKEKIYLPSPSNLHVYSYLTDYDKKVWNLVNDLTDLK